MQINRLLINYLSNFRSFDFEIELKNGLVHTFSSIEKEEYHKLFDFITEKKLRVKNRGKMVKSRKSRVVSQI